MCLGWMMRFLRRSTRNRRPQDLVAELAETAQTFRRGALSLPGPVDSGAQLTRTFRIWKGHVSAADDRE